MLVLSRRRDESISIGSSIQVVVVDIRGDKVRLGIEAPRDVPVHRQEVSRAIERSGGGSQRLSDICLAKIDAANIGLSPHQRAEIEKVLANTI